MTGHRTPKKRRDGYLLGQFRILLPIRRAIKFPCSKSSRKILDGEEKGEEGLRMFSRRDGEGSRATTGDETVVTGADFHREPTHAKAFLTKEAVVLVESLELSDKMDE